MKKLLKCGIILALVGTLLFGATFAFAEFNFNNLSGIEYVNNEYTQSAEVEINELKLDFDTADINIVFDENASRITVKYSTKVDKNGAPLTEVTLTEEGGVLSLREKTLPREHIFLFDFTTPRVTVTLPEDSSLSVCAVVDTGDITLTGTGALAALSISTDTGDLNTRSATLTVADKVSIEADTGDVTLGKLDTVSLFAETDTGDVTLCEPIFARESVTVSTDTGDVEIKAALTAKRVKIETDTGEIDADGDNAVIDASEISLKTDTGDVEANLLGALADYTVTVKTRTGDSNISNQTGGSRRLEISSSTGDIDISFKSA